MKSTKVYLFCITALLLFFSFTQYSYAQQEQKFENLKILPKDIGHDQLIEIMRNFSRALGVHCEFCHVEEMKDGKEEHDFASDAKPEKNAARMMMKLSGAINKDYLHTLEDKSDDKVSVKCITCHRGNTEPLMIEDVILDEYNKKGIDSAIATYKNLRSEYYGGFTYDFLGGPVMRIVDQLNSDNKSSDAIKMLALADEYFNGEWWVYMQYGDAYANLNKKDKAIENYNKAISINPRAGWQINPKLEKLKK